MSQSIDEQLKDQMKTSMKAKDKQTLGVVRMVRAAMQERMNQPNGPQEATDQIWQEVIGAYIKRMGKAAEEYRKTGEQGAAKLAELEFEISYLKPYLPAQIEGAELEAIVKEAISKTGASTMKEMGKVMGFVMKDHKGRVDSKAIKEILQNLLG